MPNNANSIDAAARPFFKNGIDSFNALSNQLTLRETFASQGINKFLRDPANASIQINKIAASIDRNIKSEIRKLPELVKLYKQEIAAWTGLKTSITNTTKEINKIRNAMAANKSKEKMTELTAKLANATSSADEAINGLKTLLRSIQAAEKVFLPRKASPEFFSTLPTIKAEAARRAVA